MSISCYPWIEQMQPSDSVIHMVVRLSWVKADLSSQRHLESLCRRLCTSWLEKLFSDTVLKREYVHRRTWWTAY
jgi:hypothetical protein